MTEEEKKELYETIMQDVAKIVKQRIEEIDADDALNEATSMMKMKSQKATQHDLDRMMFDEYYNKLWEETIILSDPDAITKNDNYKKLVQMGHRIVPFIYERITNDTLVDKDISIALLPEIYGERFYADTQSDYRKLWAKKIKESGDI